MATVLTCWKDVATYLGKGVRTVQRWESDQGLPIRRAGGSMAKKPVFALSDEIDVWVRGHRVGGHQRFHLSEREIAFLDDSP